MSTEPMGTEPMGTGPLSQPLHLIVGPAEHGVVRHACRIADAGNGQVIHVSSATPSEIAGRTVIVHFTDRLFGTDARLAADRFADLVAPARRVVTVLHDLPQSSDGHAAATRAEGYRQLMAASTRVVVSSHHEAELARRLEADVEPSVIALPIDRWHTDGPAKTSGEVATLGFLYPGKGIEELIDAVAPGTAVVNLGRPSPGHEDLGAALTARAQARGVTWRTTGWLPDDALRDTLLTVAVPVATHRHISASASINTWIEAGRRPIVTESSYARELSDRMPGALRIIPDTPDALSDAVAQALADPGTTWLPADLVAGPTSQQAATALEAL